MKFIANLFILMTITFVSISKSSNPFFNLKFDKVVMYDFEGGKGSDLHIVENGKLAGSIKRQVELDKETITNLNLRLGRRASFGGVTASCYDPHLGFVYYLNGKIVGYISICLDCNRLYSSFEIPVQKQGKVGKGEKAYYLGDGLSLSFRKFLNSMLVKNNFSHQIK